MTVAAAAALFAAQPLCAAEEDDNDMNPSIRIHDFVEPVFGENAYVIWTRAQGPCWIVDPGPPPSAAQVLAHIREHGLQPEAVLLTHGHIDHLAGVPEIREAFPHVPVCIAKEEARALTEASENLSGALGTPFSTQVTDARDLPAPSELVLDGVTWQVLDTSGHSPGGRSFYCALAKAVLVGDALFQLSIGRTDFHHSDGNRLIENIRRQLFTLPDDTRVFSGHGPTTTIGEEKRYNPFLQG